MEKKIEAFILGVISSEENLNGKIEQEKCFEWKVATDNKGAIIHFEWIAGQYDDTRFASPTLGKETQYERMKERVVIPDLENINWLLTAKEISEIYDKAYFPNYFWDSQEKMIYNGIEERFEKI